MAKAAVVKPVRPRILEVDEVKEVKDSEAELDAELFGEFEGEVEASRSGKR